MFAQIAISINSIGSLFSIFFTDKHVQDHKDVLNSNSSQYSRLFEQMLEKGVLFPPSAYEACFVSASHDKRDIDRTISVFKNALIKVK